jgi:hypothetical protein
MVCGHAKTTTEKHGVMRSFHKIISQKRKKTHQRRLWLRTAVVEVLEW